MEWSTTLWLPIGYIPNLTLFVSFSDGLWDVLSQSDVAELVGSYLESDPEVYEPNAATMLIKRAVGEGWDGKQHTKLPGLPAQSTKPEK